MTVAELKIWVAAAEAVGGLDSRVYWQDGRDGTSSLVPVAADIIVNDAQHGGAVMLVLRRSAK